MTLGEQYALPDFSGGGILGFNILVYSELQECAYNKLLRKTFANKQEIKNRYFLPKTIKIKCSTKKLKTR